jgi:hypothetical protein
MRPLDLGRFCYSVDEQGAERIKVEKKLSPAQLLIRDICEMEAPDLDAPQRVVYLDIDWLQWKLEEMVEGLRSEKEGYKLVPIEPTPEMLAAGQFWTSQWKAAIAAAPQTEPKPVSTAT